MIRQNFTEILTTLFSNWKKKKSREEEEEKTGFRPTRAWQCTSLSNYNHDCISVKG